MRGTLLAILAFFGLWAKPAPVPKGDIRFEGNTSYASTELLAILRNRYYVPLEGDFGVTDADDAAYFLRTFYFSRGYRDASVAYTFRPTQPPAALFVIQEGARDSIGTVTFEGESAIPPARLGEIFNAAVRQATLRPFGRLPYVESAIEAGRTAIITALAQKGYLVANVILDPPPPASANGLIDLHLRIDQGLLYSVRDVSFTGAPVDAATLRGVLSDSIDAPYQRNQEALMRNRVQDWLRNHGYLEAHVETTAHLDPATGHVAVAFTIDAGRTYTIGTIRVENSKGEGTRLITTPAAILSRFAIHPGAPYDASKVDAAARRLWFSGAFAEAEVQRIPRPPSPNSHLPSPATAPAVVDLLIKVEETSAKRLQFGVGYSEWDGGTAELHYIDRNFFGTLNRFSVDTSVSQRSYGVSGALTDPWLFGTDFEGTVGLSYAHRELPAYRANEAGGTLTLARNYSSTTLTGYRLQYGYKNVTNAVVYGNDPDAPDPNYSLGSLTFTQTYDTRNNIISPMSGLYLSHEIEFANPALLGDTSFLRLSAQFTYYLPLREITTEHPFVPFLIFNHRVGVLLPYGDTTSVPIPERFFLGGPNTVRSYQLDGLGPKDTGGDPLGGLAMLLFNAEIQWPVYHNIYLAAFTDAGNLWSDARDIQPTDLEVAAGPGLRFYTPLGAIRIDYGYNVNRQQGDPVGNWQIGFGFTF
jgi:outer membrane protein assembly complex protein YaeT